MLEKDMEDLIAAHPKDFFRREFVLIGRQQSFAEVGRFDLLFKDEYGCTILVELKARVAKYEDASQLAKYKDELERRGTVLIQMWLIAPHIPPSVRQFLDHIGIQYTEIHEAEFRTVAQRYGKSFSRELDRQDYSGQQLQRDIAARERRLPTRSPEKSQSIRRSYNPSQVAMGPTVKMPSCFRWRNIGFDLKLDNPQDLDRHRFVQLVNSFESSVTSAKNAKLVRKLGEWASDPIHNQLSKYVCRRLLRWVTSSRWQHAVPHAEAVWVYLFGSPVPSWYTWNQAEKTYHFDSDAWKVWFDSLRDSVRSSEAIYKEHNHETARSWPAKDQCQCQDCQNYRRAHPTTSSL